MLPALVIALKSYPRQPSYKAERFLLASCFIGFQCMTGPMRHITVEAHGRESLSLQGG